MNKPYQQPNAMAPSVDLSDVQRQRRWLATAMAIPALLAAVAGQSYWQDGGWPHLVVDSIGYLLVAACIVGRTWCALYIGGRKKTALIQHGPYSLTRNPLYLFSVIGVAGVGLSSGSIIAGAVFGAAGIAVFARVVAHEERYLRQQFGAAYSAYARTVPRWLPDLSNWRDTATLRVSPRLVVLTFRDATVFALAASLLEAVEELQLAGWLPIAFLLP